MIYLILAFCSSALISIVMRLGENRIQNNISTLAVNYLMCLLLSLAYSAGSGSLTVPMPAGRMTVTLGLLSGFFYMGSFILYQHNIYRNGVLMSSTFMKLGVLVPTLIAIIAFGERPGALQLVGICLAVAAIIIVNGGGSESATVTAPKALILLLLVGGSGDAMSKFYEELGRPEFSSQYLLYTFAVALVLCTMTALLRGQRLDRNDILFGCLVGIPNYYSARFLLLSLSRVPAMIAYPAFSVCTILLVGAAGVLVFHEKMTSRQWLGVAIVIVAMILLNM
jgi:drug/metabolite transporter (DMT)-like permease